MKTKQKVTVPNGWVETSLATLGRLHCGQSPSSSAVNGEGKGMPYVSGPEHWDGFTLHLDKWTTQPKRLVPDGCIFITVKGAGVGTIFPGVECAIGRDIYAFEPSPGVSARFVELAIRATVNEVVWNARGDIPGLSKSHILDHQVLVPGPTTQERIAAKIDELFSDIEAGKKSLERAALLVKRYRQSVLKAAVTGELTKDWRAKNLARLKKEKKTGADLLADILVKRRAAWEAAELAKMIAKGKAPKDDKWKKYVEPTMPKTDDLPDLPEGWVWGSWEQLSSHITSGSRAWSPYYDRGPGTFIMAQNVRRGRFDMTHRQSVDPPRDDPERHRTLVAENDLLVTIVGANTGDVCRVDRDVEQHYVCQSVALLRPIDPSMARYIEFFFCADEGGQKQFRTFIYGAGRPHLSFDQLKQTAIPIPCIGEMELVIASCDAPLSEADASYTAIEKSKRYSAVLRQSVLRAAFSAQLVPQDPHDEPVSALLERIRVERNPPKPAPPEAQAKTKKPGNRGGRRKKAAGSSDAQGKLL